MTTLTSTAANPDSGQGSPGYRRYVLWLLFFVAIVNFFDRQIMNILAEPIKRDMGLADWQLGMLTGLSFAFFYAIAGVPIAIYADRANRARVISFALFFWSFFTVFCGLAQNFVQLALSRLAVGLGESGCQPPSVSLISDYVPRSDRSSALAHYSLGISIGALIALVTGGILADMFNWRTAFLIAGTPGILLALLVALTLKDPRSSPAARAERPPQRPIRECLVELRRTPIFWWICAGSAAKGMISYGQIAFLGSFFLRVHADGLAALSAFIAETLHIRLGPLALVGLGLGLITAVGAVLGTWLGGRLGDRIARRNMAALLLIPTIASPLAVPLHVGAFLAPSAWMSMLLLVPPGLLGAMWLGPTFAALQSVVHPDNRSTAAAIQASFVLLIGLGLGPLIVGSVSDLLSGAGLGEAQGVRWALVAISCVGLVAGALFFGASRRLKESLIS